MTTDRQRDKVAAELMAAYVAAYDSAYQSFHPARHHILPSARIFRTNSGFRSLVWDLERIAEVQAQDDKLRDLRAVCEEHTT